MQIDKYKIKNILIIKFKAQGDILLSQPAIRAVKQSYPNAKITVLVNKSGEEILTGLGFIDEIMTFDKSKGHRLLRDLELIERVAEKRFDMVIDLFGNMRSALLAYLSGAKYRVGMKARVRKLFYNIKAESSPGIVYNVDAVLGIVKAAGAETKDKDFTIVIPDEAEDYIKVFWVKASLAGKKVAGINPFSSCMTRDWGQENFVKLADGLKEKGFEVLIIWGPGQEEEAAGFAVKMKTPGLIAPKTDIKQLAALFKRLSVAVTPTTFTQHLGVALGTPTVTIAGATDQKAWSPEGNKKHILVQAKLECIPCEKTFCEDLKCMRAVSVADVMQAVSRISE